MWWSVIEDCTPKLGLSRPLSSSRFPVFFFSLSLSLSVSLHNSPHQIISASSNSSDFFFHFFLFCSSFLSIFFSFFFIPPIFYFFFCPVTFRGIPPIPAQPRSSHSSLLTFSLTLPHSHSHYFPPIIYPCRTLDCYSSLLFFFFSFRWSRLLFFFRFFLVLLSVAGRPPRAKPCLVSHSLCRILSYHSSIIASSSSSSLSPIEIVSI